MKSVKTHCGFLEKLAENGMDRVDARNWNAEWSARWVVSANLIDFASRAERSPDVALHTSVRFARATHVAAEVVPAVRIFRFSDATFGVAERFEQALSFAVALHHVCHGLNVTSVLSREIPVFHHTIMPHITIARGDVLVCGDGQSDIPTHYLITGSGIEAACKLERESAGGLLTMDAGCLAELALLTIRGDNRSTAAALLRWIEAATTTPEATFFMRGRVFDFPWLLLRPFQAGGGEIWCCPRSDFTSSVRSFLDLWELSLREFHSGPQGLPLSATKHANASLRHGIQCVQAVAGQGRGNFYELSEVRNTLLGATG